MKNSNTFPDSDESARKQHGLVDETDLEPIEGEENLQTSHKSGKRSSAQKLAASRPEFGGSPGGHPVSGSSGDPREGHPQRQEPAKKEK